MRAGVGVSRVERAGTGEARSPGYVAVCAGNSRRRILERASPSHLSQVSHLIQSHFSLSFLTNALALPRPGPSYTMRSVALSALLVVAVSSVHATEEQPKPAFTVRARHERIPHTSADV